MMNKILLEGSSPQEILNQICWLAILIEILWRAQVHKRYLLKYSGQTYLLKYIAQIYWIKYIGLTHLSKWFEPIFWVRYFGWPYLLEYFRQEMLNQIHCPDMLNEIFWLGMLTEILWTTNTGWNILPRYIESNILVGYAYWNTLNNKYWIKYIGYTCLPK
jgi:hypothetical protein